MFLLQLTDKFPNPGIFRCKKCFGRTFLHDHTLFHENNGSEASNRKSGLAKLVNSINA